MVLVRRPSNGPLAQMFVLAGGGRPTSKDLKQQIIIDRSEKMKNRIDPKNPNVSHAKNTPHISSSNDGDDKEPTLFTSPKLPATIVPHYFI